MRNRDSNRYIVAGVPLGRMAFYYILIVILFTILCVQRNGLANDGFLLLNAGMFLLTAAILGLTFIMLIELRRTKSEVENVKTYQTVNLPPDDKSPDPKYWKERGYAAFRLHRWKQAEKCFRRWTELETENYMAWSALGDTLRFLTDTDAIVEDAIHAYERALRCEEVDSVNAARIRGHIAMLSGNSMEAKQQYDEVRKARIGKAYPYYNLARAFCLSGAPEVALKHLAVAVQRDKTDDYRRTAVIDRDLSPIRDDPIYADRFWEIVGEDLRPGD